MPRKPTRSPTNSPNRLLAEIAKLQRWIDSLEDTLETQTAAVKETKAQLGSAQAELRMTIRGGQPSLYGPSTVPEEQAGVDAAEAGS